MTEPYRQLPVQLPLSVLHKLIDLQRVRGPAIGPDIMAQDPVRKNDIPSKAAVIRSLIEDAHKKEFDGRRK